MPGEALLQGTSDDELSHEIDKIEDLEKFLLKLRGPQDKLRLTCVLLPPSQLRQQDRSPCCIPA
eukprot:750632-Hanusia_phi.AAC.3